MRHGKAGVGTERVSIASVLVAAFLVDEAIQIISIKLVSSLTGRGLGNRLRRSKCERLEGDRQLRFRRTLRVEHFAGHRSNCPECQTRTRGWPGPKLSPADESEQALEMPAEREECRSAGIFFFLRSLFGFVKGAIVDWVLGIRGAFFCVSNVREVGVMSQR